MSRSATVYSMTVTRGATWEDYFDYTEDDETTPIDLTGYTARMHVRTIAGQYGTTTTTTLMLELTTENDLLAIVTPSGGTVPNRVTITVPPDELAVLNPTNLSKVKYAYSLELVNGSNPEYVIPLVRGKVIVLGEITR